MLKLRKIKQSEYYNVPKVLPPLFWTSSDLKTNYFVCFRSLTGFIACDRSCLCVAQYNKKLIGTECWICLDLSNGNVDSYNGSFYCWIFNTKEEAEKQYQKHKVNNLVLAALKKPAKYIITETIKFIDFYDDCYYEF